MLLQSLFFVLQSVADILCGVFLLRFLMQWARVSFRNPVGQFVIAASDWAVRPARKLVPGLWGLDLPCLALAWLVHVSYFMLVMAASGLLETALPGAIGSLLLAAALETARTFLYLVFGIVMVIVSAVTCFLTLSAERRAAASRSKPGPRE